MIDLKGGKDGVLQNSQNLCAHKQSAAVRMQAQNDKTARFAAPIATSCKHHKKKKRSRRHRRAR